MCSAHAACVHGVAGASIVAMLAALRRTERCISASSQNGGGRIAGADERQGRGERFDTGDGMAINPAWAPDGTKIAFSSNDDGNEEIFIMNADGTNRTQITR